MGPGLYVHIPFCQSRCGYCTFVSQPYHSEQADQYLQALAEEWKEKGDFVPETLFIGGGTPSVLSPQQLERLLSFLPRPVDEATCELNPDSASREKLRLLKDWGINRLSFGVQTFSPAGLTLLGRRHDAATARAALAWAADLGFSALNVDLLYGWPGQSQEILAHDVKESLALGVRHLSAYTLIMEASARSYAYYRTLLGGDAVDEEIGAEFWEFLDGYLEGQGFSHYETSNFAQPGFQCRHNVNTWEGGEYVGIGLGAHSHRQGERWGNTEDWERYCQGPETRKAFSEILPAEAKARECAAFWLRLFRGVDLARFRQRTGFAWAELYQKELPALLAAGLLEYAEEGTRIRVPRPKQIILDAILMELV